MARNFDISKGAYDPANANARQFSIEVFCCPSFPGKRKNDDLTAGTTNYAGCHHYQEAQIDDDNSGLLFLNSRVRYAEITDGASNTILYGEMLPYPNRLGWASGTRSSLRNTGSPVSSIEWRNLNAMKLTPKDVGGFGSMHQGGANFVLADGAVKFLTSSIDPQVYEHMGNRQDGEMISNHF